MWALPKSNDRIKVNMIVTLVFIKERWCFFDAPIDSIWKLSKAHAIDQAKVVLPI
jgi:hypothetical protein